MLSVKISTEGSLLFNFFNPYIKKGASSKFTVVKETLSMDLAPTFIGVNEGHLLSLHKVPDLNSY